MHRKEWSHSCTILGLVIAGVVAPSLQNAYADGKYFPEKAHKAAPAIPGQRAILVYRDGTETLTIESALDGRGQEFGWIIPLPSRPTAFEETSAGLIQTLSLVVQPKITHDLTRELSLLWRIALLMTLGCLIVAGTKHPTRIRLLVLLLIVCGLLFMPTLGVYSTGLALTDTPGIRVYDVKEIGSYELAVLEADSSEALDGWLRDSGFAGLTQEDEGIISDYIKSRWCFVAAKLRRDKEGYSRPHPLSMSFPTQTPIYPVRLTGTTGSDVYLEIFVIADRRVACEKLTLEVSDTYRLRKRKIQHFSQEGPLPGFVANTYRQEIGHPSAHGQMWDGCVLSKLCGSLTPRLMNEDIELQLETGEPYQKHYYSRRGARGTALAFFLSLWCILPIVLTGSFFWAVRRQTRKAVFLKRVALPALPFSFLICGITYAVLPKADVISVGGKRLPHWIFDHIERRERAVEILGIAEAHDHFAGMSKDEIARLLGDFFTSKGATNVYTGEPIKEEDSPGNYTLLEDDRGVVWRTYSMEGYPDDCVLVPTLED